MTENNTEKKNRAVLVGLSSRALAPEENADEASMEELSALLETAGGECVGVVTQSKDSPDPRPFIGEGKVTTACLPPSRGSCQRTWGCRCWTAPP